MIREYNKGDSNLYFDMYLDHCMGSKVICITNEIALMPQNMITVIKKRFSKDPESVTASTIKYNVGRKAILFITPRVLFRLEGHKNPAIYLDKDCVLTDKNKAALAPYYAEDSLPKANL